MDSDYTLEVGTLDLIRQLAERQADHMHAVGEYLEANTSLASIGGLVMDFLKPQYDEARSAALRGYVQGATVCDAIAERATHTREAYVAAERTCHEQLAAAVAGTDIALGPFMEPGSGPWLGGPGQALDSSTPVEEDEDEAEAAAQESVRRSAQLQWDRAHPDTGLASQGRPQGIHGGVDSLERRTRESIILHPVLNLQEKLEPHAWNLANKVDNKLFGTPGSPTTLRQRFDLSHEARLTHGYASGYSVFSGDGDHVAPAPGIGLGTAGTIADLAGGALQVRGAYDAVQGAVGAGQDAVDSWQTAGSIISEGNGPSNTDSIDWAER